MFRKLALIMSAMLMTTAAFGLDKEEAKAAWDNINKELIEKKIKTRQPITMSNIVSQVRREEGTFSVKVVCYTRQGEAINADRCEKIWDFINEVHPRDDSESRLKKYSKQLDDANEDIKGSLGPYLAEAKKYIESTLQKSADNSSKLQNIKAAIASKMQSKECKTYKLSVDICQKAYVDNAGTQAVNTENEITKETGMVNRYSRYKIGQLKQLHGTGRIPVLKADYKRLTGKDWQQSSCGFDEPQKLIKNSFGDEVTEEAFYCGCDNDNIDVSYSCE
jgi:hypothetical protein